MVLAADPFCFPNQVDTAPLVELGQVTPYRARCAEHMVASAFQKEGRGGNTDNHGGNELEGNACIGS